ncbi:helix-turn-helix domain-containing protein [bacterium]|nr:helix-turn-helix domain-containing protein [bacterium]
MTDLPLGHTGILGLAILFGILQGLFLGVTFWIRRRGDRVSNRLLGSLILVMALHLCEIFLLLSGLAVRVPYLAGLTFPLLFLVGPLFYLYGRRLLVPGQRLRWLHLLHAIPWGYMAWRSLPDLLAPAALKIPYLMRYQTGDLPPPGGIFLVILSFNVLQHAVYAYLTLRLVRRREADARGSSADNAVVESIIAFRRLTTGFVAYTGLYFLFFLALTGWGRFGVTIDSVWLVILALFVQGIGYLAIAQPETFAHSLWDAARDAVDVARDDEEGAPAGDGTDAGEGTGAGADAGETDETSGRGQRKYLRSALSENRARRIHEALEEYMRAERPYLDGSLKLRNVAARLGVSPHHLSQVINRDLGRNFFDFVNDYRVEEAKRLLADPTKRNLTVLAIGFEAGFNNKASFNTAFRKFTETTPSAFRELDDRAPDTP